MKSLISAIVRQGETLSEIASKYCGSTDQWRKIFEANRETVQDANTVGAGTKLIVPDQSVKDYRRISPRSSRPGCLDRPRCS